MLDHVRVLVASRRTAVSSEIRWSIVAVMLDFELCEGFGQENNIVGFDVDFEHHRSASGCCFSLYCSMMVPQLRISEQFVSCITGIVVRLASF